MSRRRKESAWESPSPRRGRRIGLGKVFLLLLVFAAALAWFAPMLIMQTSLRDTALSYALPDFPGRISLESGSAGWLSPIEIRKLVIADAQGIEVAVAESVKTEKSLWSLVTDLSDIGTLRIEQPQVQLALRPDGSNVEDLLQPFLTSESTSSPLACVIEVVEGRLAVQSTVPGDPAPAWSAEHVNANVHLPGAAPSPIKARLDCAVALRNGPPGKLAVESEVNLAAGSSAAPLAVRPVGFADGAAGAAEPARAQPQGTVALRSESLPLGVFHAALQRLGAGVQLQGILSADMTVEFNPDRQAAGIRQLSAQNLYVSAPQWLGPDPIQLAALTAKGNVERAQGLWKLDGLSLSSDVLQFDLSGSGPAGKGPLTVSELFGALRHGAGQLRCRLDVARLAATLPKMLRIREGTHVSSGEVAIDVQSRPEGDVHHWSGSLEAQGIAAIHQGKTIAWRQPVVARAEIRQAGENWSLDRLTCESSFLKVSGRGTLAEGELTGNADLARFLTEVGQFIQLGSLRGTGQLNGKVLWKREGSEQISLQADGTAEKVEVTADGMRPWREPRLDLNLTASATATGAQLIGLHNARLLVKGPNESLTVGLREPVSGLSADQVWPLHISLAGPLSQWLARLQLVYPLSSWQLDGDQMSFEGDANISRHGFNVAATDISIQNLRGSGAGLFIREPQVKGTAKASYDFASGELSLEDATLSSTTVALRAENVRLVSNANAGATLDGRLHFRTDLERLLSWLQDPQQPASFRAGGAAAGEATFASARGVTQANMEAEIENLAVLRPSAAQGAAVPVSSAGTWSEVWQEPRLKIALQGNYEAAADRVLLQKMQAAGESFSLGAAGEIRHPFTTADAQIAGEYAYDLAKLADRLRGVTAGAVKMSGDGKQPFRIQGPLLAALNSASPGAAPTGSKTSSIATTSRLPGNGIDQLMAEAGLAWQSLEIQGIEVGPAQIQTRIEHGILTVAPLEIPLSDGVLKLAPTVDLTKTPSMVSIAPGTLVDQVRISPEMCRTWLKYVAPLVADATAAEGRFSVQVSDALFPANNVAGGNVQGKLIVHSARIGPGPLAQELLLLVEQVKSLLDRRPAPTTPTSGNWLEIPQQELNLQLADQRVYHRDLQMTIKDIVVRTQGWVGMDQQLALVAEVPVRDEWVAQDRFLSSLRGQSIRLPIHGTLSRPQIDRRALTELSRQTIRDAGTNFLQEQLNRGLERLLPRPPPAQP